MNIPQTYEEALELITDTGRSTLSDTEKLTIVAAFYYYLPGYQTQQDTGEFQDWILYLNNIENLPNFLSIFDHFHRSFKPRKEEVFYSWQRRTNLNLRIKTFGKKLIEI